MANRLPREKIDAMWCVFQEHGSAAEVARKCGVHHKSVARVRRIERWDQRLAEILAKAQAEADTSLAAAMADSLKLIRKYKRHLGAALDRKTVKPDDFTAGELEKIVKLESFVLGGSEHRAEVVGRFTGWSDDQLEAFAREGTVPR